MEKTHFKKGLPWHCDDHAINFYGLYTVNQDLCSVYVFDDFYGMKAFSFIISRHIFKLDEIRVMEPKSQKYAIDGAECLSEFFADELW